VNVVVPIVPAAVVTSTVLLPQQAAFTGTLKFVDQLPDASIDIAAVFQETPSNLMPPTGIVSKGTKLDPDRVTEVYRGPLLGEIVTVGVVTVKLVVAKLPPEVITLTVLLPATAFAGTLSVIFQLPQLSTWIALVFHEAPAKVMPPTGIVSRGPNCEPDKVTCV
jgi:hypothetical protein